jgi:hypothetical protein
MAPSCVAPWRLPGEAFRQGSRTRIADNHIRRSARACGLSRQVRGMTSSLEVGDLVSGWCRTVVLDGVSLTTTPGSTLAVLGRNGAGKTTLFATLMGLTTLHGGTIRTIYGSRFAKLLEMPEKPRRGIPIARQLPGRYLPLFTDGCGHAIAQAAPVRLSGVVEDYGQIELYRAAFMPLAMRLNSSKQLVLGTFNRRRTGARGA